MNPSPFDVSSPLFPSHTQLNITMKRRPDAQLLNFMLPENLDISRGSQVGILTEAERGTAIQYTFKETADDAPDVELTRHFRILSVSIILKDVYLQVRRHTTERVKHPPLNQHTHTHILSAVMVVVVVVVVWWWWWTLIVVVVIISSSSSSSSRCCVSDTRVQCRRNVLSPTCSPATVLCSHLCRKSRCITIPWPGRVLSNPSLSTSLLSSKKKKILLWISCFFVFF